MIVVEVLRWIGWSHLLQPPLTLLLASPRGLNLRGALGARSGLVGAVLQNMAVASVALPTGLGLLLALRPAEALGEGTGRDLALLLGAFWSFRLYRQVRVLGPAWPGRLRALHWLLLAIFAAQGPGLIACVMSRQDRVETRLSSSRRAPQVARPSKPVQPPSLLNSWGKA